MSHMNRLPHPLVMPDLIRHPVLRELWIADQVRNDKGLAMTAEGRAMTRRPSSHCRPRHCEKRSDAAVHAPLPKLQPLVAEIMQRGEGVEFDALRAWDCHSQPVMPDLIRHPVPRETWIADQVRNDKSAVRNCKSSLHIFEPCCLKHQNP